MLYTLRFFFSSKCSLFHNANLFGSCIIHILYTGCAKIKKNNFGAKGLNVELNSICHLLALLEAHLILNVSRIRVNSTFRATWISATSAKWSPYNFLILNFRRVLNIINSL